MANLKYCYKHNMVAFLKKPTESEGFTEIVDFLKGSSLRYALTHNPPIYDSLVKQFWQTATVRTLANGIQQIIASIDNKKYIVTEASVKSTLQLADATGINNLPDTEIYEGLTTLGYVTEGKLTFWKKNFSPQWKFLIHHLLHCISPKSGGWDQFGSPLAIALIRLSRNRAYNFSKLIFDGMVHNIESTLKFLMYQIFLQIILDITTANNGKYLAKTLTKKLFANMKRGYAGDHVPLLPAMLDTKIPQSQGPTIINGPNKATTTRVGVDTEGATTTTSGLDAGLDIGNIHESPLRSYDTPLHDVPTSESVEDSMKLQELSLLVPKLEKKIDSLENKLKETKQTLGSAILTLVKKVKSLEVALKRKYKKVAVSDTEEEETEPQGRKIQEINDDPLVSLVEDFMTPTKTNISASGEEQVEDISPTTLEAAKTLSKVASQKVKSTDKGRRYQRRKVSKGKDISTGLDVEAEVSTGREDINTGKVGINTGSEDLSTGGLGVSTGIGPVSTPSKVQTTTPSPIKGQRDGKAPMTTEEIQATKRSKAQIQQEEVGLAEAIRLHTLQEEEATRQVYLDELLAKRIQEEQELSEQQKKRKAEVQEAAQHYTEED
ncbi:hypothetical protein Tco_0608524 [Tanacetum coccineum]